MISCYLCLWTDLLRMFFHVIYYSCIVTVTFLICLLIQLTYLKSYFGKKRNSKDPNEKFTVAFFHPYCYAGGGGERVLWCAIRALETKYSDVKIVVYTGDIVASPCEIIKRARLRFGIEVTSDVEFVYLRKRRWVEAECYPYFTLLGQSFGSIILGFEALFALQPDVFIDSTGYAFTLPVFSYIGGCACACYIHYPTITREMFKRIPSRSRAYSNRPTFARSPVISAARLLYYKLLSWVYSECGKLSQCVMVNSSWTEDHINQLWDRPLSTFRVYPPCDTATLKALPMAPDIIGQYKPEKDHPLQMKAMYELRQLVSEAIWDKVKLVFIGSCRNKDDEVRAKDMMDLCRHLSLENNIEFKINISYEELKKELQSCMIGLHAMWNEHFGISVVECMAAGQIMVAHKSGGPKSDIIEESEASRNGFLATDECEYAGALLAIIKMHPSIRNNIRLAARSSVDRFSTEEFHKNFLRAIDPLIGLKDA